MDLRDGGTCEGLLIERGEHLSDGAAPFGPSCSFTSTNSCGILSPRVPMYWPSLMNMTPEASSALRVVAAISLRETRRVGICGLS